MSKTPEFPEHLSGLNLIAEIPQEYQVFVFQGIQNAWTLNMLVTKKRFHDETQMALQHIDSFSVKKQRELKRRADILTAFPRLFAHTIFKTIEEIFGERPSLGNKRDAQLWQTLIQIIQKTNFIDEEEFEDAMNTLREFIGVTQ